MHMRRARRERRRAGRREKARGVIGGFRVDPENRYGQARAHPSIALPDYRLEQKMQTNGEARHPLSADGVCGTEARQAF